MLRLLLFLVVLPVCIAAQGPGKSDMLLFSLTKSADSSWQVSAPKFLTVFNRGGYNNQPFFFSAQELWLTASSPEDAAQTDIYSLDLAQKVQTRVTATPSTSEYSPTPMPGGKRFSAVRVEEDGNQRLWSFPIDRSDNGRVEFPKIFNVGYHCWLRDTLAVLFIVGENDQPHSLHAIGVKAQRLQRIASNAGRCLAKMPDGRLLFIQKPTEQTWFLKTWEMTTNSQEILLKMPTGTEDFCLLSDGAILCGNGTKLYQYNPRRDQDWRPIADLNPYGVKKITRLAASKDGKLAVVVE